MNKSDFYKALVALKRSSGIDVSKEILDLSKSHNDVIPSSVIHLLNDNDCMIYPYKLYDKLSGKPVMKNILSSDKDSAAKVAKTLSSLITHSIVEVETMGDYLPKDFYDTMRLESILTALVMYLAVGNTELLISESSLIRSQYLSFIGRGDN